MKINGWTDIKCATPDCAYCDGEGDCFYPGLVKLNQKCENYISGKVKSIKNTPTPRIPVGLISRQRSVTRKH